MRTVPLSEYIQRRVAASPEFREAVVNEALDTMLAGDNDAALALLEDVAKARSREKGKTRSKPVQRSRATSRRKLIEA